MTRRIETLPAAYFDALYRSDPDPWGFRTRPYERAKYDATLSALGKARFERGLEVGCSIGVLTRDLAGRCETLLAIDGSQAALEVARADCSDLPNVTFERRMLPAAFPDGDFDLILLSEVLYYLSCEDLSAVAARCFRALMPGGTIVLCHWMGETDYPLTGEQATDLFLRQAADHPFRHTRLADGDYRLHRLVEARTGERAADEPGTRRD